MPAQITLLINGENKILDADPAEPLLYILREDLKLNGPRFGCGLQQCGSCLVLSDNKAVATCLIPCSQFEGKKIETIEGLNNSGQLHPVQEAFLEVQAAQCGYCLNGMLIAAVALLREKKNPSEAEIKEALHQVICRCGTHSRFIKAVKTAAQSTKTF